MKAKVIKRVIIFTSISCLVICSYFGFISNKGDTLGLYEKLNQKEKESLEFFFRAGFYNTYGYVLFGDKPISISQCQKTCIWDGKKLRPFYKIAESVASAFHPDNLKIKKGWKVLKKYKKYLDEDGFLIRIEPNPWNRESEFIVLINKSLFFKTIDNHLEDFVNVLGDNVSAQDLWDQCKKGKNLFEDLLKEHNGLIGTLLGYGRDNAWNFHERELLLKEKGQDRSNDEAISELNDKLKLFASEEQYNMVSYRSFNSYLMQLPKDLSLPMFSANPDSLETKSLLEIYKKNRENIISLYREKDFLKVTIEKFQRQGEPLSFSTD